MTPPPFQRLLDLHGRDVYRFLVAHVGAGEADDCWQETYLSALQAYPKLRHDENLKSWILTIAHRKALDAHRRRARSATPMSSLPEAVHEPGAPVEVWDAVRGLPDKQRTAVVLRFANDLRYAEVGTIAGTSEAAARQNVREGLKKLRKELEHGRDD